VILSLEDKRTTAEALGRNGLACFVSEERLHRAWGRPAYGGRLVSGLKFPLSGVSSASLSFFGGLPGLNQAGSRVFAAPLTLDLGAKQEGGDP
jgi:hypothetical protein